MYIGMNHLAKLCEENQFRLLRTETRHGLTGWAMLETAPIPYNVHLVYITNYNVAWEKYPLFPGMHLILLADEDVNLDELSQTLPSQYHVLLYKSNYPESFLLKLQEYFEYTVATGLFAQSLLEIMSYEGGIQGMVNHAFKILENPIFVFDSTFNLIAANWEEAEKEETARNIIQNKGLSEKEFELIKKTHVHKRMMKSDRAVVVYQEELGYEQMIVAIDTERDLGHIVVCATNRHISSMDQNSLWILKQFINQQMKKDEFILNSKGFHYENFLKDLLDDKIAINQMFLDRMQYVGVVFSSYMRCAVVEIARTSSVLNPYRIRNLFENHFHNIKTLIYSGQIVIIFQLPEEQSSQRELQVQLMDFCMKNNLYAGISNSFDNILSLPAFYKQALRAIELGIVEDNMPKLFVYQDYFLEHMKNIFIQKESKEAFCHPRMKILLDYDEKKHSSLAYTLYMYLLYERNMGAAADAMHMHRSSLSYRFRKIISLIGDDFEDPKERQYLMMSYELNKPLT